MSTQPEALRLADALLKYLGGNTAMQAAAELRRLHAERTAADGVINDLAAKVRGLQTQRDALLEALHSISLASQDSGSTREGMGLYARAAIAKAEENT